MAEEIAVIKAELDDMKSMNNHEKELQSSSASHKPQVDITTSNTASDRTDADIDRVTLIIHKTLDDNARRKRNVIISGLPDTGSPANDRAEFLRICEQNLSIKPYIADNACVRLGKKTINKSATAGSP